MPLITIEKRSATIRSRDFLSFNFWLEYGTPEQMHLGNIAYEPNHKPNPCWIGDVNRLDGGGFLVTRYADTEDGAIVAMLESIGSMFPGEQLETQHVSAL